jgi:hypothetical protein
MSVTSHVFEWPMNEVCYCLTPVVVSTLVTYNCNNTTRVIKFSALLICHAQAVCNCTWTRGACDIFALLRRVSLFSRKCTGGASCVLINVGEFGTKLLCILYEKTSYAGMSKWVSLYRHSLTYATVLFGKVQYKWKFAQVGMAYTYSQPYIYIQGIPFEVKTPSLWTIVGCSMAAPSSMSSPSSTLLPPSSHYAFIHARKNMVHISNLSSTFIKILCLKLCNLTLYNSGSVCTLMISSSDGSCLPLGRYEWSVCWHCPNLRYLLVTLFVLSEMQ